MDILKDAVALTIIVPPLQFKIKVHASTHLQPVGFPLSAANSLDYPTDP